MRSKITPIINDGVVTYKGSIDYWKNETKHVNVDGEVYTKSQYVDVTSDVSEIMTEKETYYHEYDFSEIGCKIKIADCNSFGFEGISSFNRKYSTNAEANSILVAFENKLLDSRIKDVFSYNYSKCNRDYTPLHNSETLDSIFSSRNGINLDLLGYGYNNRIGYTISIETFLENIDKMPKRIIDFFTRNKCYLNSKDKNKNAINMLKLGIRHKKQKYYETSKH